MIGKERIKPPDGPTIDCQPPVKFANTGKPSAPSKIYRSVASAPRFAPSTIAASGIINVCKVIGTPSGIGNENGAIMQIIAAARPMKQMSCMFIFFFFILNYSP